MAERTVVAEVSLLSKIASYIELTVKDPHSTVFVQLSDAYRKLGLFDEAVETARKGTAVLTSYPEGFVALGRSLAEKQDLQGAGEAFRQALEIDSGHIPALAGLARIYVMAGEAQQAIALLQRAQQAAPDDQVIARMLASIPGGADQVLASSVIAAKSLSPSEPSFADVHPIEPTNAPISTATIADIYVKQGFPERALKVYSDILASEPENFEIRQRYDALQLQLSKATVAETGEHPQQVEGAAVSHPVISGPEGLISIYRQWLDVLQRRRVNV